MSIFKYLDIDVKVLSFCDLIDDYPQILLINRYYYNMIMSDEIYKLVIELRQQCSGKMPNRLLSHHETLLMKACYIGNPLYIYLVSTYYFACNVIFSSFEISCVNGQLSCAQFLHAYNLTHNLFPFDEYHGEIFRNTCKNGHLTTAQWLLDLIEQNRNVFVNINYNMLYAFILSCQNGHLKVAHWLLEVSNRPIYYPIDIHVSNDAAFIYSFGNHHFAVSQWLTDLSRQPRHQPFREITLMEKVGFTIQWIMNKF